MWSESPWKQNKETGKPLPISAKFKEEGDNHAGVLGKEVGRTCGNRLEDIGRPACSGCLFCVLFFCPCVFTDRPPFFWVHNLWDEVGECFWVLLQDRRAEGHAPASLSCQDPRVGVTCSEPPISSLCWSPERAGWLSFTLLTQTGI